MYLLNRITIIACVVLATFNSFSQKKSKDQIEIEEIQKRKVIVMIEEPSQEVIDKLTKKKKTIEIALYKTDINLYNVRLKESIEKNWTYNKEILYKTNNEISALQNSKEYVVIRSRFFIQTKHTSARFEKPFNIVDNFRGNSTYDDDYYLYLLLNIVLIENFSKNLDEFNVFSFPDRFPTKTNMAFTIKSALLFFDLKLKSEKEDTKLKIDEYFVEISKLNAPKLKNLTLMIRKDNVDEFMTDKDLKALYPFPFKIASEQEIDIAFSEKTPDTAYLVIIDNGLLGINNYILESQSNQVIAVSKPFKGGFVNSFAGKNGFSKKIILQIVDQINGKK